MPTIPNIFWSQGRSGAPRRGGELSFPLLGSPWNRNLSQVQRRWVRQQLLSAIGDAVGKTKPQNGLEALMRAENRILRSVGFREVRGNQEVDTAIIQRMAVLMGAGSAPRGPYLNLYLLRARLQARQGNHQDAERIFRQALDYIDDNSDAAVAGLFLSLRAQRRHQDARPHLARARSYLLSTLAAESSAATDLQTLEQLEQDLATSLEIETGSGEAWVTALEPTDEERGHLSDFYLARGRLLLAQRNLPTAERDFSEALSLNAENQEASAGLAIVHGLNGNYAPMYECYAQAREGRDRASTSWLSGLEQYHARFRIVDLLQTRHSLGTAGVGLFLTTDQLGAIVTEVWGEGLPGIEPQQVIELANDLMEMGVRLELVRDTLDRLGGAEPVRDGRASLARLERILSEVTPTTLEEAIALINNVREHLGPQVAESLVARLAELAGEELCREIVARIQRNQSVAPLLDPLLDQSNALADGEETPTSNLLTDILMELINARISFRRIRQAFSNAAKDYAVVAVYIRLQREKTPEALAVAARQILALEEMGVTDNLEVAEEAWAREREEILFPIVSDREELRSAITRLRAANFEEALDLLVDYALEIAAERPGVAEVAEVELDCVPSETGIAVLLRETGASLSQIRAIYRRVRPATLADEAVFFVAGSEVVRAFEGAVNGGPEQARGVLGELKALGNPHLEALREFVEQESAAAGDLKDMLNDPAEVQAEVAAYLGDQDMRGLEEFARVVVEAEEHGDPLWVESDRVAGLSDIPARTFAVAEALCTVQTNGASAQDVLHLFERIGQAALGKRLGVAVLALQAVAAVQAGKKPKKMVGRIGRAPFSDKRAQGTVEQSLRANVAPKAVKAKNGPTQISTDFFPRLAIKINVKNPTAKHRIERSDLKTAAAIAGPVLSAPKKTEAKTKVLSETIVIVVCLITRGQHILAACFMFDLLSVTDDRATLVPVAEAFVAKVRGRPHLLTQVKKGVEVLQKAAKKDAKVRSSPEADALYFYYLFWGVGGVGELYQEFFGADSAYVLGDVVHRRPANYSAEMACDKAEKILVQLEKHPMPYPLLVAEAQLIFVGVEQRRLDKEVDEHHCRTAEAERCYSSILEHVEQGFRCYEQFGEVDYRHHPYLEVLTCEADFHRARGAAASYTRRFSGTRSGYERAIEMYARILSALSPGTDSHKEVVTKFATCRAEYAQALNDFGWYDHAVDQQQKAHDLDSSNNTVHLKLIYKLEKMGRWFKPRELSMVRLARGLDPDVDDFMDPFEIEAQLGRAAEVLRLCKVMVKDFEGVSGGKRLNFRQAYLLSRIHFVRGIALRLLGREREALLAFERCEPIASQYEDTSVVANFSLRERLDILLNIEEEARALEVAEEVLRRQPDKGYWHDFKIRALLGQGKYSEALDGIDLLVSRALLSGATCESLLKASYLGANVKRCAELMEALVQIDLGKTWLLRTREEMELAGEYGRVPSVIREKVRDEWAAEYLEEDALTEFDAERDVYRKDGTNFVALISIAERTRNNKAAQKKFQKLVDSLVAEKKYDEAARIADAWNGRFEEKLSLAGFVAACETERELVMVCVRRALNHINGTKIEPVPAALMRFGVTPSSQLSGRVSTCDVLAREDKPGREVTVASGMLPELDKENYAIWDLLVNHHGQFTIFRDIIVETLGDDSASLVCAWPRSCFAIGKAAEKEQTQRVVFAATLIIDPTMTEAQTALAALG
ncbi:MAG: hypothetical protein HQ596_02905 [Candidatus Saganbacteria bacterium]|nr:hypothetical protein [Candidatus Saganbacteria bacterium]